MGNGRCQACGWMLRWTAEQNAWVCESCRAVFPVQAAAAGHVPYGAGPYGAVAPQAQGPSPYAQQGHPPHGQPSYGMQGQPPYGVHGQQPYAPHAAPNQPYAPHAAPNQPYAPHAAPSQPYAPHAAPNQPYAPHAAPNQPYAPHAPHGSSPSPHAGHAAYGYGAQPAPAYATPSAPPPRRSGKALWIGIGGALVAAGVVVAVVLATRGGDRASGAGSRDELARATVAALAKGDIDKLIELGDPAALAGLMDCKQEPGNDADPDGEKEKLREQHAEVVAKTKGAQIDIIAITARPPRLDANGKNKSAYEKGQKLGPRCTAKVAMVNHKVDVKLKLGTGESVLTLEMLEADGKWYLVDDIELEAASASGAGAEPDEPAAKPVADTGSAAVPATGSAASAPPPPAASGGAASASPPPAAPAFAVGDRVMAQWTSGNWYPGKIAVVRPNGTYDVAYDDGDYSRALPPSKVRKRTGRSRPSSTSSANDAPCPGPGHTRRCNGVCVNIGEDSNHCGGCNYRCPAGKTCQSLFCRDANGNL